MLIIQRIWLPIYATGRRRRSIGHNAKALNFPQKERNRGAFDGWDPLLLSFLHSINDVTRRIFVKQTRPTENSKFNTFSSPPLLDRAHESQSLWFSWNLNGVSRERRNIRRSKRSPLRAPSPPITVPIKGGGIEPPPFFLFSSFFLLRGWVDRCKGRRRRGSSTLRVCWRHF